MPIHKGSGGNLSNIYLGSQAVQKVYKGSQQVWPVNTAPTISSVTYDTTSNPTQMNITMSGPATLYWLVSNMSSQTANEVKTGGGLASGNFLAGSSGGGYGIDLSSLTGQTVYIHIVAENASGLSNVVSDYITIQNSSSGTITYVNQHTNTAHILIPDLSATDINQLTIACSATSVYPNPFAYFLVNSNSSVRLYDTHSIRCVFKNAAGTVVLNQTWSNVLDLTTKKHFLLVVDVSKGLAKLWVDGVSQGTKTITQPFSIGTAPRLFAASSGAASCGLTEVSQVFVDTSAHVAINDPSEATDVAKFYAAGNAVYNLPQGHTVLGEDMTVSDWNNGVNKGTAGSTTVSNTFV